MATSLLALLDDIASVLDDVSLLTKRAAHKTAGVLGDDLALNAQQVAGVPRERELPVVWAVARGSLLNKAILVPSALLLSVFAPSLVQPLLMIGGAFLCYEGFEKLWHRLNGKASSHQGQNPVEFSARLQDLLDGEKRAQAHGHGVNPAQSEREKIRGAIRTDFVLSAEIVAITLGTVVEEPLYIRALVLIGISLCMTVGVYGLVAGIVKLDDLGLHLHAQPGSASRALGRTILVVAPRLMRVLSIVGTAAMFLVGGGILVHGLPRLEHVFAELTRHTTLVPAVGRVLGALVPSILDGLFGVVAGGCVLAGVGALKGLRAKRKRD